MKTSISKHHAIALMLATTMMFGSLSVSADGQGVDKDGVGPTRGVDGGGFAFTNPDLGAVHNSGSKGDNGVRPALIKFLCRIQLPLAQCGQ